MAFRFTPLKDPRWRKLAGPALLALWSGWMLAAFAAIRPAPPVAPALPGNALAALQAALPPGIDSQAPLAVRLAQGCACAGDDAGWKLLAEALASHHGTHVVLDRPLPELDGHAVVILGGDGHLRYAGALQPDPALCGTAPGPDRLAHWLPALLAASGPVLLPARGCAC